MIAIGLARLRTIRIQAHLAGPALACEIPLSHLEVLDLGPHDCCVRSAFRGAAIVRMQRSGARQLRCLDGSSDGLSVLLCG